MALATRAIFGVRARSGARSPTLASMRFKDWCRHGHNPRP